MGIFACFARYIYRTFTSKATFIIVAIFSLSGCQLSFVTHFKYLGHIIEHTLHDDSDINRELSCLFTRTNVLVRRFGRCSLDVKLRLFRTYCLCFYDMSLWKYNKVGTMNKLAAAYIKCIKIFFGYAKFSSVTVMLLELGLPCFSTLLHNARVRLTYTRLNCSVNSLVRNINCI